MAYIQKNNPFKQRVNTLEDITYGKEYPEVIIEGEKNPEISKEYPEVLIKGKRKPKVDKEKLAKAGESINDYGNKITERGKEMYEGMKKYLSMYTA